jgi:Rieske Fe-S protein
MSLGQFAGGQAGVVKDLAEYLTPGEIGSADALQPGQGGILREALSKVAIYRSKDGQFLRRSAVCTHMDCIVHWNAFEQCWDCPCHGSQFAPDGEVLNGPAVHPLGKAKA